MGWVSKSEDDQEACDCGRDFEMQGFHERLSSLSARTIDPGATKRVRLTNEVENLRQYQQVVEFLLKSARSQIAKLETEIRELHTQLALSEVVKLEERKTADNRLRAIQKAGNDRLRATQKAGEDRLRAIQLETESKFTALEAKLSEYRFNEFAALYSKSQQASLETKFGNEKIDRRSKNTQKAPIALNPVIPPDSPNGYALKGTVKPPL